jgi:hypothetical protein
MVGRIDGNVQFALHALERGRGKQLRLLIVSSATSFCTAIASVEEGIKIRQAECVLRSKDWRNHGINLPAGGRS